MLSQQMQTSDQFHTMVVIQLLVNSGIQMLSVEAGVVAMIEHLRLQKG